MFILIDTEKAFDRIQHPLMIKNTELITRTRRKPQHEK